MELNIGNFYEKKFSINSAFDYSREIISCVSYAHSPKYVLMMSATLNFHKSASFGKVVSGSWNIAEGVAEQHTKAPHGCVSSIAFYFYINL